MSDVTTLSLVGRDGSVREFAQTRGSISLSSDGTLAVSTRTSYEAGVDTLLINPRGSRRITDITPLPATGAAWKGDVVAILAQTQLPRTADPALFIADGVTLLRIPLP